jgi:hypothetical protein
MKKTMKDVKIPMLIVLVVMLILTAMVRIFASEGMDLFGRGGMADVLESTEPVVVATEEPAIAEPAEVLPLEEPAPIVETQPAETSVIELAPVVEQA